MFKSRRAAAESPECGREASLLDRRRNLHLSRALQGSKQQKPSRRSRRSGKPTGGSRKTLGRCTQGSRWEEGTPMAGQRGGKSLLGPLPGALQLLSPPGMLSVRTSHGPLMCRQAVKAAGKSSGMFVGTSEMGNCRWRLPKSFRYRLKWQKSWIDPCHFRGKTINFLKFLFLA